MGEPNSVDHQRRRTAPGAQKGPTEMPANRHDEAEDHWRNAALHQPPHHAAERDIGHQHAGPRSADQIADGIFGQFRDVDQPRSGLRPWVRRGQSHWSGRQRHNGPEQRRTQHGRPSRRSGRVAAAACLGSRRPVGNCKREPERDNDRHARRPTRTVGRQVIGAQQPEHWRGGQDGPALPTASIRPLVVGNLLAFHQPEQGEVQARISGRRPHQCRSARARRIRSQARILRSRTPHSRWRRRSAAQPPRADAAEAVKQTTEAATESARTTKIGSRQQARSAASRPNSP